MWRFGVLTALCLIVAMASSAAAYIIGGQTYLPLRTVGESFGASIFYNSRSGGISISLDYQKVNMTVGSRRAYVGQREIILVNPIFVYGGVCYVPARFVSDSFGFNISWHSRDRQIFIVNPRSKKQITLGVARHVPPGLAKKGGIPPGQRSKMRGNDGGKGKGQGAGNAGGKGRGRGRGRGNS